VDGVRAKAVPIIAGATCKLSGSAAISNALKFTWNPKRASANDYEERSVVKPARYVVTISNEISVVDYRDRNRQARVNAAAVCVDFSLDLTFSRIPD
jgi:hypothetical protein